MVGKFGRDEIVWKWIFGVVYDVIFWLVLVFICVFVVFVYVIVVDFSYKVRIVDLLVVV